MIIAHNHLNAKVVSSTPEEHSWLHEYLSFRTGEKDKPRYSQRVEVFNILTDTFPAGFVPMVSKASLLASVKVELLDKRIPPCQPDPQADLSWLRPYQKDAVDVVLAKTRGILWHPTGCLAGDTKLRVNRGGATRLCELKTIVARLSGEATRNRAGKLCRWDLEIPTKVQSVDSGGFVKLNEVVRAYDNGIAEVFEVITRGDRVIRATAEHMFSTPTGFVRLQELAVGDVVNVVRSSLTFSKHFEKKLLYETISGMQNHPYVQITHSDRDGRIFRVPVHRLVTEAMENGISLAEFVGRIVLGKTGGLAFFDPKEIHVHHRDKDVKNNTPDNLEVLPAAEHLKQHGEADGWKHLTRRASLDTIRSITSFGEEHTYDLEMAEPLRNYVANEFVVHNSGKTEEAVALGLLLPCRWLFVVNSNYLVEQAAARFEQRTGQKAGRIGEGEWQVERFTCATFQTLYKRLNDPRDAGAAAMHLLDSAQGLIVDECHVLPADSFWQVAMKTRVAYWRVGTSGTPLARGDRRSLLAIGALGPVIHRIRPEVLIEAGVLSRPRIRVHTIKHDATANTWAGVYRQCIVEGQRRNEAVVSAVKRSKKPCLVFVKEIEHGRTLEKMLLRAGYPTEFVYGDDTTYDRKGAIRRLVRGDYQVLVASVVFNTGVDIPELRSVIVASGGKSTIAALQRIGRGMRVQKDADGNVAKDEFEVVDFADEGDKWLRRHTKARLRAYQSEGYEVVVVPESEQLLL